MITPPLLERGARVALVAPAGPLADARELERAVTNTRDMGWEPAVGAHALARRGYFAGTDDERVGDLNAALADDTIDAVWFLRGGYGAMRILDRIDFDALRRRPRAVIGYSDITAIHAAIAARVEMLTYHAPTARGTLTPFSRASLERAIVRGGDSCGVAPGARPLRSGRATGRLMGGNLALLAALVGTPYFPTLRGAILVIEDINEAVYRLDRMVQQLRLAGALDGVLGIAAGEFVNCSPESDDGARSLDDLLVEIATGLAVPCLAGVPVGHVGDQWTLPLGAMAELDVDARRLTVRRPGE